MDWWKVLAMSGSVIMACWFMHQDSEQQIRELGKESRDFHGRLCTLEEKYIQMMERFMNERGGR